MLRSIVLGLLIAPVSLACTCSQRMYRPACETFYDWGAIFLGTVKEEHRWGDDIYQSVRIDEVYRGIPAGTRQIFVNSDDFCGRRPEIGKQHLFYSTAPYRLSERVGEKKMRKLGLEDVWLYSSSVCNGTREAVDVSQDVQWLRSRTVRPARTSVYGTVFENREWRVQRPPTERDVVLGGATVVLNGQGKQYVTRSNERGQYQFEGIPSGRYEISSQKANWISSPYDELVLYEGGCARRNLSLKSKQ